MKILHIAHIRNNPFNGVCVAVPAHLIHQSKLADVALLNIIDCKINGVERQFVYTGSDWRKDVSEDFKKPDIVVFHEVYHIQFAKIAKSLRKLNIPYVIIPHGSLVKEALQKKKYKKLVANFLIFNSFVNGASALQVLSKNELSNTAFRPRKFIGTNGIEIPDTLKTSFNDNKLVITYIGRLEVYVKGLDLLLTAINQIIDFLRSKNAVVNIYGPDAKGRLDKLKLLIVKNKIQGVTNLHHEISGAMKNECLLDSDIFLQVSRHEGMPMGILEAMSYGLPCIITRGTCLGDIVEKYDAGWVADTNVESIKDTLVKAIDECGLLKKKSENARRLVVDNYSWNVVISKAIDEYKKIIKSTN